MQLDAYIRVSETRGREDNLRSPEYQKAAIEAWAAAYGHTIQHWEVDLDQSGKAASRPAFDRVLDRIDAGQTGGMVVSKLDRFARSVVTQAATLERISAAGGVFVSLDPQIDSSTAQGRMVGNIMASIAQSQREVNLEARETAKAAAIARGVHISPVAPTGYKREPGGALELDPKAAPVVAEAFRARAGGASWAATGRILTAGGVGPRPGSTSWSGPSIAKLIRNEVYLGVAFHGSYRNTAAHPPLVERFVWEAAQIAKPTRTVRQADGEGFLLAGLLRCAGCSYIMSGSWAPYPTGPVAKYNCRRNHAAGQCPAPATITAALVEPFVSDQFLASYADKHYAGSEASPDREALEAALTAAEASLTRYLSDGDLEAVAGREAYIMGAQARKTDVDAARMALALLPSAPALDTQSLRDFWQTASTSERRELLAADMRCVMTWRGRGDIGDRVRILDANDPVKLPSRGAVANVIQTITRQPRRV